MWKSSSSRAYAVLLALAACAPAAALAQAASAPAGLQSGPPSAVQECLPADAGGTGRRFAAVAYPQKKATIYTWLCADGEMRYVAAPDSWKPKIATKTPAEMATEIKRLQALRAKQKDKTFMAGDAMEQIKRFP